MTKRVIDKNVKCKKDKTQKKKYNKNVKMQYGKNGKNVKPRKYKKKLKLDSVCRKRAVSNSRPACREALLKFIALLFYLRQ